MELSQERLHMPPVAELEGQGSLRLRSPDEATRAPGTRHGVAGYGGVLIRLFVLMNLVLLCTSQNGEL